MGILGYCRIGWSINAEMDLCSKFPVIWVEDQTASLVGSPLHELPFSSIIVYSDYHSIFIFAGLESTATTITTEINPRGHASRS